MIRNALNQQTAAQFKQYAEQQYPGNPAQVSPWDFRTRWHNMITSICATYADVYSVYYADRQTYNSVVINFSFYENLVLRLWYIVFKAP